MVFLFLVLISLAYGELFLLSTERNEGAFALKDFRGGLCFVGRIDTAKRGYDAVLGRMEEGTLQVYRLSSPEDDYSYTVEILGNLCVGGVTSLRGGGMGIELFALGETAPHGLVRLDGNGNDMLWFMERVESGFLLVGGVELEDWDILLIKLNEDFTLEWSLRLGTDAHEYAYGVVEGGGDYIVVGRSYYASNWDGFLLKTSKEGRLKEAWLIGGKEKDYLRYVGVWKGKVLAVGRSEHRGQSDVLLLFEDGTAYLYDGGDFDYGRVFVGWGEGILVMGDTYEDSQSDGLALFLDNTLSVLEGYRLGGNDVESIRFLTPQGWFAGYSYSFSFDNDILIGRFDEGCTNLISRKSFKRFKKELVRRPYPLQRRPYTLRAYRTTLKVFKHTFSKKRLCPQDDSRE